MCNIKCLWDEMCRKWLKCWSQYLWTRNHNTYLFLFLLLSCSGPLDSEEKGIGWFCQWKVAKLEVILLMRNTRVGNCFTTRKYFMQSKVFTEVSEFTRHSFIPLLCYLLKNYTWLHKKEKNGCGKKTWRLVIKKVLILISLLSLSDCIFWVKSHHPISPNFLLC